MLVYLFDSTLFTTTSKFNNSNINEGKATRHYDYTTTYNTCLWDLDV